MRDGRHAVVKIQYSGVPQAIRDDLANTELLAAFLRFTQAASRMKMDIRSMAREAAERICEEVDYQHEAADPITKLGKLHHTWVGERGLPSALDQRP